MNKIYTGVGDGGETSSLSGNNYRKDDDEIEVIGNLDEVIALLEGARYTPTINKILETLGTISAEISNCKTTNLTGTVTQYHVDKLQEEIDAITIPITKFMSFYNKEAQKINHVRTVVRRLERSMTKLLRDKKVRIVVYTYINRLSDYLFMVAVDCEKGEEEVGTLTVER